MPCTIAKMDLAFEFNHLFQNYLAKTYFRDKIWPLVAISNVKARPDFLTFFTFILM